MLLHRWVVLAAALSALALPAAARAETFCVNHPTCVGSPHSGVQEALDAAAGNGVRTHDRIEIGPGTYVHGPSGRFTNVPMSPVTMVGSGSATVLTSTSSAPPSTYVLDVAEKTTRVTDLSVRIASTGFGIRLAGIAERVSVTSSASVGAHMGVFLKQPGVFRHGEVELLGPDGLTGTGATGPGTIEDSSIRAGTGAAAARLHRVRIRARTGVFCAFGTITVDQALIELVDSPASVGLQVTTLGSLTALNATNVTVAGAGTGIGVKAAPSALMASGTASLSLSSSVLRGVDTPVERTGTAGEFTGTADVTIRHSSYDLAAVSSSGAGALTATEGNIDDVDARVVGAGDYRLRHDSPLVDAGDPAAPGAGASVTDTAAQPRVVDGDAASGPRRDMGAFEYQRKPPAAALAILPASPLAGQDVHFSAAASFDPDGEALSYAWSFAGDADPGAGQAVTRRFANPGRREVTVKVTDATGLTSTRSLAFTVRDPSDEPPEDPPPGSRRFEVPPPGPADGACLRLRRGTRKPETLRGGRLGDRLVGRGGDDLLVGRGGDDCLAGQGGGDTLRGGKGRDVLKGGRGHDRIDARDRTADVVDCGAGRRDVALVDRADRVRGCERVLRPRR